MSFTGKVVIVTGASSGIGAAVAVGFSAALARVVIVGRNESRLAVTASRCNSPLVIKADVANDDDVHRIINQTVKHFGQIDILVNVAGIVSHGHHLLSGTIMESYSKVMPVNLRAVVLLTSLAAPYLIKTKGNVINMSSISGELPAFSGTLMYAVSKAALNHFGICAAAELAPHGVRVNTISPGPVQTELTENSNSPLTLEEMKKMIPLEGRVSAPEEIADLVMFIASDKSKAITGSKILSDNGIKLR